jgi:exosortase E/protease (VPEID-CTERM system)
VDCSGQLIASQATALANTLQARNLTAGRLRVSRSIQPAVVGAIALLGAELLYLTFRFDTQGLVRSDSVFALILGWAPHYLRLSTTVALLTIVLAGDDLLRGLRSVALPDAHRWRIAPLAVHATFLLAFIGLSASLFESDAAALSQLPLRSVAWFIAGAGTLVAWSLAVFPTSSWAAAARAAGFKLAWAGIAGGAIWSAGFATEQLWRSLAFYTFAVVDWTLHLIYPLTISDTARLVVGTPTFKVSIAPECSGYEGIGLIVGFLSVYLWLCRRELRFPAALVLLPIGAMTIWIVNAFRIVALVAIGTSGWPAIARGGFHSQAGWIAFNVIALGFVGITMRGGFFQQTRKQRREVAPADTTTTAYLAPFAAMTATAMLTGAVSAGFDWLYPLRVLVVAGVLWACRRHYTEMKWSLSPISIAIGAATCVMWLALLPSEPSAKDLWPAALSTVPFSSAAAWLAVRGIGYVVMIPIVEELAFRGFLGRRLLSADFQSIPAGRFSWVPFLVSSVLFGAMHGQLWIAGTLAGMAFALALYRRGAIGDAVQAHATTNGLLMLYALTTGHWSAWS